MSETKFFYLRDQWMRTIKVPLETGSTDINTWTSRIVRGNPFGCIAYERHPDTDNTGHDHVLYAVSVTNTKKDKFLKSLGRKIASDRLSMTSVCHRGFVIESTAKSTDLLKQIMFDLVDDPQMPKSARNSIESWFNLRSF